MKRGNTLGEKPLRMRKNNNPKMNCDSAIGLYLITNPECAETYPDDNLRIIGQARSSFHEVFWNQFTLRLKTQPGVDKKSSFLHLDSSSKQW